MPAAYYSCEVCAFFWKLPDRARFAFFRMDVHIRPRHIQITAHHERSCGGLKLRRVRVHRFQEAHLRGEILPTIRDVNRRDRRLWQLRRDDAVLVVEFRMMEEGAIGMPRLSNVQ